MYQNRPMRPMRCSASPTTL